MLQVPDGPGRWRTVIEEIGFPVGRPQTVTVDLTGVVSRDTTVVRIVTTMRVYWDRIAVGTDESVKPVVDPAGAGRAPTCAGAASRPRSPLTDASRSPTTTATCCQHSPWKVLPGTIHPARRRARPADRRPTTCSSSRVRATRSRCRFRRDRAGAAARGMDAGRSCSTAPDTARRWT